MAEGFAHALGEGVIEPYSAGLMAVGVNPRAAAVMREMGIDISRQRSKEIDPELLRKMDVVVTLCRRAEEACPYTPSYIRRIFWPIEDPVGVRGSEEYIMKEFRRARNEIRDLIVTFIKEIKERGAI